MKNTFKQIGKALLYFGVYLGGQFAASIAISIALSIYAGFTCAREGIKDMSVIMERHQELYLHSTGLIVFGGALIAFITLLIVAAVRKTKMSEMTDAKKVSPKTLIAGYGIGLTCWFIINSALLLLPIPQSVFDSYGNAASGLMNQNIIFAILGNIIAAPIIEEIIFRGLVFGRLKKGMPVWLALILSSLLFGLCHVNPLWISYAAVLGMVFAFIYHKTGSILPGIMAHMACNLTSTALSYSGISVNTTFIYIGSIVMITICAVCIFLYLKKHNSEKKAVVSVIPVNAA